MKKKFIFNYFLFALSMLILSGCLSPVKTKSDTTYLIKTAPLAPLAKYPRQLTLLVMQPEVSPAYNSTQMAYTLKPYQISYYAKNRWVETPGQMLQPLMVQALQNTNFFRVVVTTPFVSHYDYVLSSQILRLDQDFTSRPAMLRLTLRAQLSRMANDRVIALKQFDIAVPMRQNSPYGGVIAANEATGLLLQGVGKFCINAIRR